MKSIVLSILLLASCNPIHQSNNHINHQSKNPTIQQSHQSSIQPSSNHQPSCEWCGAMDAPKDLSWKTTIAPKGEPGEPIIISGTIYQPDGKTPAKDVLIYAYHTNNEGRYLPVEPVIGNERRHGHLRGWMRTNADGKYQFRSIKPRPYPNRNEPAHIHITLSSDKFEEYWISSTLFQSDPLLTSEQIKKSNQAGKFGNIIALRKDKNDILRGTRDIRLK